MASKSDKIQTVDVSITVLRPADYNPRTLSKRQFNDIKASIEKFGFVSPIIVNKYPGRENIIIGGHQRVKVAGSMGYKFVPCVFVSLAEDDERELNVRLNKNAGDWDFEMLANVFETGELLEWGFTSEELGGSGESLEEDDDAEPAEIPGYVLTIQCTDLLQLNELYEELRGRNLAVTMKA